MELAQRGPLPAGLRRLSITVALAPGAVVDP